MLGLYRDKNVNVLYMTIYTEPIMDSKKSYLHKLLSKEVYNINQIFNQQKLTSMPEKFYLGIFLKNALGQILSESVTYLEDKIFNHLVIRKIIEYSQEYVFEVFIDDKLMTDTKNNKEFQKVAESHKGGWDKTDPNVCRYISMYLLDNILTKINIDICSWIVGTRINYLTEILLTSGNTMFTTASNGEPIVVFNAAQRIDNDFKNFSKNTDNCNFINSNSNFNTRLDNIQEIINRIENIQKELNELKIIVYNLVDKV